VLTVRSRATPPREPRQVREEAALSEHWRVPRACRARATDLDSASGVGLDGRCTVLSSCPFRCSIRGCLAPFAQVRTLVQPILTAVGKATIVANRPGPVAVAMAAAAHRACGRRGGVRKRDRRLFLWPASATSTRARAVVVFTGGRGERLRTGCVEPGRRQLRSARLPTPTPRRGRHVRSPPSVMSGSALRPPLREAGAAERFATCAPRRP